jgi:glutathione S-transferase
MFKLIIADKRYSSWSLRAWLVLEASGLPFEEEVIRLYKSDTAERIRTVSPSGKIPCLVEQIGDRRHSVWDSLAIAETIAEQQTDLWPGNRHDRATARAIVAEMHAGFLALRESCPFDLQRAPEPVDVDDTVKEDIARLCSRIADGRGTGRHGEGLFGAFGIVDAYMTPIAARFRSYEIHVPPVVARYRDYLLDRPAFRTWEAAALIER